MAPIADLGCQNSKPPERVDMKFGMGDYVGATTPRARIQSHLPLAASECTGKYQTCGL